MLGRQMSTAFDRPAGDEPRVTAVLGPTNTGKTHLAIERMLGHRTGMIGFPLRLLARENYDRIVKLKGTRNVALITGEERIVPPAPRWFVCTVEAMPLDREVEFLAVDEIQVAADRERGHIFTDRLLHARGYAETMFLGSETAKPLIRKLVPRAEFVSRPRFSKLTYRGPLKITRLPRRTAVVAFSAADVYGIAELVRRQRGGAAVVFGALSPRTRNAQVAMYQAGEVDYLIATDAIGMGLNMDIDHVAFAELVKFDGRMPRRLSVAELAQIAGRAGRHMSDGTFGTTAEIGGLDPATVEAIEQHRFPNLTALFWRNADLDFRSPGQLLASLERRAPEPELIRMREADDHTTLAALMRDESIMELTRDRKSVRLLWDVCQIPDFRKTLGDAHPRLVAQIFRRLRHASGTLPTDWVATQVARLEQVEGDIDALLMRLAHVRTWTYISHRPAWLEDAAHWQERTRAIEDRLSDALHERLTQRFVDRRAAALTRRLNDGAELMSAVTADGEVLVEGQFAGRLEGFRFVADPSARDSARALISAANRAVRQGIGDRVRRFCADDDGTLILDPQGTILWHGQPVARLAAGEHVLAPRVEPLSSELLDAPQREAVRRRLSDWLAAHLRARLRPLFRVADAELSGTARGIAFELTSALGTVPRAQVASLVDTLSAADRTALARAGVEIGSHAVYLPALKKEARLRLLLQGVKDGTPVAYEPDGRISLPRAPELAPAPMAACGYLPAGPLYVRADRLERFAAAARRLARQGPFQALPELATLIGAPKRDLAGVLGALGYVPTGEGEPHFALKASGRRSKRRRRDRAASPHSPFAELRRLVRS
jgi:ATP-dependent RNA helicase SUPV3L1/SUV3